MGKGRRDGVWTGNRGVTKASPASGSTKAQEGTARLGVKEGKLSTVQMEVTLRFKACLQSRFRSVRVISKGVRGLKMANFPATHRGHRMNGFVTELTRVSFIGLDRMHHDLHEATKAMNDRKLMKIICLQNDVDRLKKENAKLQGRPEPSGAKIRTTARKRTHAPPQFQAALGGPSQQRPLMQLVPTSPMQAAMDLPSTRMNSTSPIPPGAAPRMKKNLLPPPAVALPLSTRRYL
uniref:Uncharacterized protein n=1 Tax=Oryza brachyantha TaxID=4533 RepID=J3KVG3_ORYBR